MPSAIRFERWSTRLILTFSLLFLLWFAIAEWDGLVDFIEYLWGTIAIIPQSVETVITYYDELPAEQLVPSLLLGGVFGAVMTALLLLLMRARAEVVLPSPLFIVTGIFGAMVTYLAGVIFINAVFFGVLVTILVAVIFQPGVRATLLSAQPGRLLLEPFFWLLVSAGLVGGMFGSQLMAYPTQHCTYADDAQSVDRQIGAVLVVVGALIVLLPVWTLIQRGRRQRNASTAGYFSGWAVPVAFLLPTILSLVVFLYYPAVQILTNSLAQSNPRLRGRSVFVCMENYVELVQDVAYQNSLIATAIITVAVVAFGMIIALGIAVLAAQKVRGAYIYRTLLIWPYALSPVVAGVIFYTMFQQDTGLINYMLERTFSIQPEWRSDVTLARIMVIFASVWNILGFNILFYVAGLQNIPEDLLEAAEIDGANRFQRFFRITLPLLSPFTFFLLITNITYSFYGIYGVIDVLTQGGPQFGEGGASGATDVLIYRLYSGSSQAGSAAAQALILFVLIAALTIFQFAYVERRVTYAN